MLVDLELRPKVSCKHMLIGEGNTDRRESNRGAGSGSGDEIELMERDVKKSISNGILTIEFSDHIQQILFKEMKTTTPGLSRFMCKRSILEAVGGLVGKVAKLNFNTDSKTRGGFARMTVFVDLDM
ncbi:hypothetical protein Golob_011094 [Gossypium lobatum]|uniref:Uncharacterized protein n=1 Tax=Gossypium lobatum TaxID=34289 RepID=A0A7J8MNV8_9ROSI|nr:hypothetical protein [Gossypium lobatum]